MTDTDTYPLSYDQGRKIMHALRARATYLVTEGHTKHAMKIDRLADDLTLALLRTDQFPIKEDS